MSSSAWRREPSCWLSGVACCAGVLLRSDGRQSRRSERLRRLALLHEAHLEVARGGAPRAVALQLDWGSTVAVQLHVEPTTACAS